jgi:predicted ferric reductase
MSLIHWMLFAFRNIAIGRPFARAQVEEVSNALRVMVTVPRAWEVKAGQYIFLTIPRAGILSGVQSHPFMIAWWEWSVAGLRVYLLVKRRRGFTKDLTGRIGKISLAFIDGPYGQKHDFGDYGTVIMFATDIGIAGHIPFIKELVRGYNSCEVRTRRIVVVWQMEHERKFPFSAITQNIANSTLDCENWVTEWMQAALDDDTGMVCYSFPENALGLR